MNSLMRILNLAKKVYRYLFCEMQWIILVQKGIIAQQNFSGFKPLNPPHDRFWADPFIVHHNEQIYIFVEVAEFKKNNAYISVIELDENLNQLKVTKVLEKPWHLSYPFIFKHDDAFWMIPESSTTNSVSLYKCGEFPYQWEKYRDIIENQKIVDSSIFEWNGKWWLFCGGPSDTRPGFNELFNIFYSDDPIDGAWTPHPLNPIKCDLSGGRPAGNVFIRNGELMRPAQNCTVRYGGSTTIYRIDELTTETYSETKIEDIHPDGCPRAVGMHHFSESKGLIASDALLYISKLKKLGACCGLFELLTMAKRTFRKRISDIFEIL